MGEIVASLRKNPDHIVTVICDCDDLSHTLCVYLDSEDATLQFSMDTHPNRAWGQRIRCAWRELIDRPYHDTVVLHKDEARDFAEALIKAIQDIEDSERKV